MALIEGIIPQPDQEPKTNAVVLLDVDNTLVDGFTVLKFANFLLKRNLFRGQSFIKMQLDLNEYNRGRIDYGKFAQKCVDHYYQGLAGLDKKAVEEAGFKFLPEYRKDLYSYTPDLLELMNSRGMTIAISGSPEEAFGPLAKFLGIQETNLLEGEIIGGIYTGKVKTNMALDQEKRKIVAGIKSRGFNSTISFAFGDSNHDLPLLEAVSNPFIVSPNSALEKIAREKGWPIVNSGNIITMVTQRITELDPCNNK